MNKKGAISFSMTTIIIIVLSITMLIFGMIFVKNIMCAGIIITDKITSGVENEVKNLFGANDYGIRCMGEAGQEIKIGDGGQRQIACIINVNEETTYELSAEVESLKGTSQEMVDSWILDKDWSGTASPGQKTVTILVFDIPEKVSDTNLKIITEELNINTGVSQTHTSYINVVPVSGLASAVC